MNQAVLETANPRAVVGGNNPPSPIDEARPVWNLVSTFLKTNPVIETEETAIKANEVLGTAKNTLKSLEDEQGKEADPLYSAWKAARAKYTPAIANIQSVIDELSERLTKFMRAEKARREREAEEARRIAEEAERAAREAERKEQEARENAAQGEIGVDVGAAIETADTAFVEFKQAERQAAVAEKDTSVRFKSRFQSKATTLRTKETLVLDDAPKAITAIGVTEKIREAILSSAREYRKQHNALPDGVSATTEETI